MEIDLKTSGIISSSLSGFRGHILYISSLDQLPRKIANIQNVKWMLLTFSALHKRRNWTCDFHGFFLQWMHFQLLETQTKRNKFFLYMNITFKKTLQYSFTYQTHRGYSFLQNILQILREWLILEITNKKRKKKKKNSVWFYFYFDKLSTFSLSQIDCDLNLIQFSTH